MRAEFRAAIEPQTSAAGRAVQATPDFGQFQIMPRRLRSAFALFTWLGFGMYLVCLSLFPDMPRSPGQTDVRQSHVDRSLGS